MKALGFAFGVFGSVNTYIFRSLELYFAAFCLCAPLTVLADQFQLVTGLPSGRPCPSSGGGDSVAPVISRDGRYVVFASSANNLMVATNGSPIPHGLLAPLNVFLRDRTNGTTLLVSVNLSGVAGGNGDSIPVDISADGNHVLFESSANDLVPGDANNAMDVFVRDLAAGTTTLVSANTNGLAANRESRSSAMTPDARYVVFVSAATDIVSGHTNRIPDVFVRDLSGGTTVLASVGATATPNSNKGSEAPCITPDGRFVVFYSAATNFVPNTPANRDIYVRDLVAQTTLWASAGARDALRAVTGGTNAVCYNHRISDDGQFVVYQASSAANSSTNGPGLILRYNTQSAVSEVVYTNAAVSVSLPEDARSLDITPDARFVAFKANVTTIPSTNTCILLWDAQSGAITPVNVDVAGQPITSGMCDWPAIDPTGRYVCFLSSGSNLVTNQLNQGFHLFVRDLTAATTTLVDAGINPVPASLSADTVPRFTDDGQLVGFKCLDTGLVQNDRNHADDVFVSRWAEGAIELISARDAALPSATPNGPNMMAATSVSLDARFVAFASDADDLDPADTNGWRDVYVKDLTSGALVLASVATNGTSGDGHSYDPAISLDGRFVAFSSLADNLVSGDNNGKKDVFLRDLQSGTTACVSMNRFNSAPANGLSSAQAVSKDGRYVLFRSTATDLVTASLVNENLFLRDMVAGTNFALSTNGTSATPAMTPDARVVVYGLGSSLAFQVQAWSLQTRAAVFGYGSFSSTPSVAISGDGRRIAYGGSGYLQTVDLGSGVRTVLDASSLPRYTNLRLSGDGRLLVCAKSPSPSGILQIYLFDIVAGTNRLLSMRYDGSGPANGHSDSADLSPDGRFIAFRSWAKDILPTTSNGLGNIYLYDLLLSQLSLLSSTPAGTFANNSSRLPIFSGDGKTLLFQSQASDLLKMDFNRHADIFAYPFLIVALAPPDGLGPQISWPVLPGKRYQVQFKNAPDETWQTLPGDYTVSGNRASIRDAAPDANQRVYRVTASENTP